MIFILLTLAYEYQVFEISWKCHEIISKSLHWAYFWNVFWIVWIACSPCSQPRDTCDMVRVANTWRFAIAALRRVEPWCVGCEFAPCNHGCNISIESIHGRYRVNSHMQHDTHGSPNLAVKGTLRNSQPSRHIWNSLLRVWWINRWRWLSSRFLVNFWQPRIPRSISILDLWLTLWSFLRKKPLWYWGFCHKSQASQFLEVSKTKDCRRHSGFSSEPAWRDLSSSGHWTASRL